MADITVGGIGSYDKDSRYGLVLGSWITRGITDTPQVDIEIDPTDIAFITCAVIDKYGLDNVRRMIDNIAQQDPTGRSVGLSAPARLLEGRKLK
jgi:hypothetical protein